MKQMKAMGLAVVSLFCAGLGWANTLDWGVTGSVWLNHAATAPLYSTTPAASGASWLVQLIWAGANGKIDPATLVAGGTSGDDVVVAFKWIGSGVPAALAQGRWQCSGANGYENPLANGAQYYIRVWEGASPGSLGLVPTHATYYGDSALYTVAFADLALPETIEPAAQPAWHAIAPPVPTTYTVAVLASPVNGGTVSGGGVYPVNGSAQLSATAASGWVFTAWNDGSTQNPRTITVPANNVTYAATFTAVPVASSLGNALNAPGLVWQTGGDANWKSTTATTHDGLAAQSGALASGQQSWLQTVTNGPGSLSFWWQSAGSNGALLQLSVNGQPLTALTNSAAWVQYVTFLSTTNTYTLRWTVTQPGSRSSGDDGEGSSSPASATGWLDQVTWTASPYAQHVPQLYYQDATGLLASWVLNNAGYFRFPRLLANTAGWTLKAAGDVDGDGVSDLLFQDATGNISGWFMNADGSTRDARIWANAGSWEIKACADYLGLGHAQLFLQTAQGDTAYWLLATNGAMQTTVSMGNMGTWKLRGAGDLDGDHKAELFWQNAAGQLAIWKHNSDGSIRGAVAFSTGGWTLCGVMDIDGDGVSDLLWQATDGSTAAWFMNSNSTVRTASTLGIVGAWNLKAAGR